MHVYIIIYITNSFVITMIFKYSSIFSFFFHIIILIVTNVIGRRLRVLGLTGQICSGKSTVSRYLEMRYKACVIDVDSLNREVLERQDVLVSIRKMFGDEVFDEGNKLDKLKMRKIIYNDVSKRKGLERITHFKVLIALVKNVVYQKLILNTEFVFIENAILLRFWLLRMICYPIISICTNRKLDVLKRIMQRDKCDLEVSEKILENQLTVDEFISLSDWVIFNDSGVESLYEEVDTIMNKIKI
jgi:dephospho-CoA kinase